jgi:hypothetical protein
MGNSAVICSALVKIHTTFNLRILHFLILSEAGYSINNTHRLLVIFTFFIHAAGIRPELIPDYPCTKGHMILA